MSKGKNMIMLVIIFVISAIIVFCLPEKYFYKNNSVQHSQAGSVCVKGKCFTVEFAETQAQKEQGLMGRTYLGEDNGMLFVFDREGIYPFWMKNTLIPLDIIWIGENKKIVFIVKNVQPCKTLICPSVVPTEKAKYVLETNANISEKNNFDIGDEVTF